MTRFATALTVLAMLGLAGCAGQPAADPATSTAPAAVNTTSAPSAASAAGIPPKPDEATVKAYLDELRAIDPAIVDEDNPDKAINRGRDQCSSVQSFPADQAKLIDLTNKRFTAPGQSNGFGPEKAERILAAVRKHICPTF